MRHAHFSNKITSRSEITITLTHGKYREIPRYIALSHEKLTRENAL